MVKRVIHTTADFDYAENLRFTPGAAAAGVAAMRAGAVVITDTNMALAGITQSPVWPNWAGRHSALWPTPLSPLLQRRRARPGPPPPMHKGRAGLPGAVLAVGNAPTALLTIADEIESGLRPALVIAVPVGFVNVVESKERLFAGLHAVWRARHRRYGPQGRQQRGCRHLQCAGVFRRRDARPCGKRMAVIRFLPRCFPTTENFGAEEAFCLLRFCFPIKAFSLLREDAV